MADDRTRRVPGPASRAFSGPPPESPPPPPPHDGERGAGDEPSAGRRPYAPPTVTTRRLYERLALSCEHAVDPDTGELIIDGPS